MNQTSLSLLERVQDSDNSESWGRLVAIYTPLIHKWLKQYDVQPTDADDLVQDVLLAVAGDVKKFDHQGNAGAFRAWLKTILVNRLRKFWRTRDRKPAGFAGPDLNDRLAELENPTSSVSQIWNREHDQYVLRQLLQLTKNQFAPQTWEAFCQVALQGKKPAEVAQKLGISLNAVCLAKSRVLRRLRQEATGLVASSSTFMGGG